MAIGDVRYQAGRQEYVSDKPGRGIARAIDGLAGAFDDAANAKTRILAREQERQEKSARLDGEARWARTEGELKRYQMDLINEAAVDGSGLTDAMYDHTEAKTQEFLETLPPDLQETFKPIVERTLQAFATTSYAEEYKLRQNYERNEIQTMASEQASLIVSGDTTRENALALTVGLLTNSSLPEHEVLENARLLEQEFASAELHKVLADAKLGKGTVREADGKDVVAAGLAPWQRGFLNATARRESGGDYNVRYNGHGGERAYFDDYSDHPRVYVRTPEGDVSSAAGRYQITATTWDEYAPKVGVTDFSPESQDRVALAIAEDRYNKQIEAGAPSFAEVMSSGNPTLILGAKRALGATWAAFKTMDDREFLNIFLGSEGLRGGGTGSPNMPDVWNDERYGGLTFEQKLAADSAAASTAAEIMKRQEEQQKAFEDQILAGVAAGEVTKEHIDQLLANNRISPESAAKFIKLHDEERKAERAGAKFAESVLAGDALVNDTDTQKAAQTFFEKTGIFDGMQQRDTDAKNNFVNAFGATGVLPPEMIGLVRGMANSADQTTAEYGLNILSEMKAKNPQAFLAAVSEDDARLEALWSTMRRYTPVNQVGSAMEQLAFVRSPEGQQLIKARKAEAAEVLETISDDTLMNSFDPGIFSSEPNTPQAPKNKALFRSDFTTLFNYYYSMTGDEKQATTAATTMMKRHWAPDAVGGNNVLTYKGPASPAAGYIGKGFNTPEQIRADILASEGWDDDQVFETVVDPQTVGEINQGLAGSFQIHRIDPETGFFGPVLDEDGGIKRFRPTPSAAVVAQNEREKAIELAKGRIDGIVENQLRQFQAGKGGAWVINDDGTITEGPAQEMQDLDKMLEEAQVALEEAKAVPKGFKFIDVIKRIKENSAKGMTDLEALEEMADNWEALEELN